MPLCDLCYTHKEYLERVYKLPRSKPYQQASPVADFADYKRLLSSNTANPVIYGRTTGHSHCLPQRLHPSSTILFNLLVNKSFVYSINNICTQDTTVTWRRELVSVHDTHNDIVDVIFNSRLIHLR